MAKVGARVDRADGVQGHTVMTIRSPEEVAKQIDNANSLWRVADQKRQPFIDVGWLRYSTDIYKNIGEVRVSVTYEHENDVFKLHIFANPLVIQIFDTAEEALNWCERLEASLQHRLGP